jgi:hypothetical protein
VAVWKEGSHDRTQSPRACSQSVGAGEPSKGYLAAIGWLARIRTRTRHRAEPYHLADPRFDDWDVVHDFEDLKTARAWRDHLREAGIEAEITADWELDRSGRGDLALRVPPGHWSEAEELLSGIGELE